MLQDSKLDAALKGVTPKTYTGQLSRRVGLSALLTPIRSGGKISDLSFLFAGRNRNRFSRQGGPASLYMGDSEDVGSAEMKRVALLGDFARTPRDPDAIFWAQVHFPDAVLDLTNSSVLKAIKATDAEIYDPHWKDILPASPPELLGAAAFRSGQFAAIKYWSVRMRQAGTKGECFCIFKSRVKAPCYIRFSSPTLGTFEEWK